MEPIVGGAPQVRIVVEVNNGQISANLPDDPVLALGLLEIAKTFVLAKLHAQEQRVQPAPPGLRLVE